MHRCFVIVLGLVLIAACSEDQEQSPVTTTTSPSAQPTNTASPDTTTTVPPATATTVPLTTTTTLVLLRSLAYERVADLEFPTQLVEWDGGFSLIATKDGQVWLIEPDGAIRSTPVLDISGQVHNQGERGLLSILGSEDRTQLYVHYSAAGGGGDTVVSRFSWVDGALTDEEILFEHEQPARNHNGGMLHWGPDGLYVGLGDGGGANDRFGNGQNTDTLLGGIVWLNVGESGAEPVLWQYGLRNPWRFWVDTPADLVYIADVGQNAFEEINVAPLEQGLNYGWPITEGLHCFRPSSGCDTGGLTLPVVEVEHGDAGTCSITGGAVYRGAAIPEIVGRYFYSDYCGGYLRSFLYRDGAVIEETDWTDQVGVPGRVVSFGIDFFGEMYVLTTDQVLKVVPIRG